MRTPEPARRRALPSRPSLLATACGGTASSSPGPPGSPPRRPTTCGRRSPPRLRARADLAAGHPVRRRHVRRPGRQPVRPHRARPRVDVRPRRGHRLLHDRPAVRRGRQPARPGVRPGRGVRQRDAARLPGARATARSRCTRTAGPRRSSARDEVLLRLGVKAREVSDRDRPRGQPHVRHRHLGLDGARGPARARQAVAHLLVDRLDRARHRRDRDLRLRRPGRPRADERPRRRPHPGRDPRPVARTAPPTPRPASRSAIELAAGTRSARRAINRVDPRVGRRRQHRRRPTPSRSSRRIRWDASLGIQLVTVGLRDGQLQRRPDGAARRQAATASTPTSTRSTTRGRCSASSSARRSSPSRSTPGRRSSSTRRSSSRTGSWATRTATSPDEAFRDDTVDAGAIGAGHAVTALYALRLTGEGGLFERPDRDAAPALDGPGTPRGGRDRARHPGRATWRPTFERDERLVPARRARGRRGRGVPRQPLGGRLLDPRRRRRRVRGASATCRTASEVEDFLRLLDEAARIER